MGRRIIALLAVLAIACVFVGSLRADDTPGDSPSAIGTPQLELQVAALNTLDEFDVTPEQLKALDAMAQETAGPATTQPATGSSEYHTALLALRDDLANDQDDKVDDAQEKVDDMRDAQNIDPNIDYQITDAARAKAGAALKMMGTNQIAGYIAMHSDEVPDATDTILDAIDKARDGTDADFASMSNEAAEQVGLLAAGMDKAAANAMGQKVIALLDHARKMPQKQFDAGQDNLARNAQRITKSIDSFAALHNWMLREMADLLSNPEVKTVITAREKADAQG